MTSIPRPQMQICAICNHPAYSSPCADCRRQEAQDSQTAPVSRFTPINMGPLPQAPKPTPKTPPSTGGQYRCPLPRESSKAWKPSQSHRPLTSNDVNQPLLCNLLLDAESFYDNDHKCTRYEWTGTLKDNDVAAIVDWMKKHGATQPSSILPYYWCIENQYLKLSICSHPKGNTYITLLDLSEGSTFPMTQSSNKTESEVRACG